MRQVAVDLQQQGGKAGDVGCREGITGHKIVRALG